MPPIPDSSDHHHHRAVQPSPAKPDHKFVAAVLKALVMTFVTSIFFLFVGVAAILLLLFLSAGALHRSARFRRRSHRRRRHTNSRSALRRLPRFRFFSGGASDGDCVICLDAFRDGQWCRELAECGHVFHRRCVDTWLVKVLACPICRRHVRVDDDEADDWEDDAKWWWSFDRSDGWGVM